MVGIRRDRNFEQAAEGQAAHRWPRVHAIQEPRSLQEDDAVPFAMVVSGRSRAQAVTTPFRLLPWAVTRAFTDAFARQGHGSVQNENLIMSQGPRIVAIHSSSVI